MIQIPVIFSKLQTLADKSVKLEFGTREFRGSEVATLLDYRDQEGWLMFAPNPIQEYTPDEEADSGLGEGKSPSQRLRAVLYIRWQQTKPTDTFEEYYRVQLERIIEKIKATLEE